MSTLEVLPRITAPSQWNRVMPRATAPQWLIAALRAIVQLTRLPNNWDGFGSPPAQSTVVQAAHRLVQALAGRSLPAPEVCPVTGGGIDFTWRAENRELGIEILPDGSAEYLAVQTNPDTGFEEIWEGPLSLDRPEYSQALADWLIAGSFRSNAP